MKPETICAPAKINFYLHITSRRTDGYHDLDSLIAFTDTGDSISVEPAEKFSFSIKGPFASVFTDTERSGGTDSGNLAVRAAYKLAEETGRGLDFHLTLTKNLPAGAGLGGGSADAAAVLRLLAQRWDISLQEPFLQKIAAELGADVPVCLYGKAARVLGRGEIFAAAPAIPDMLLLLVHPGIPCSTAGIFSAYGKTFQKTISLPDTFETPEDFIAFLEQQDNALTESAIRSVPEIREVLSRIAEQEGCRLARMSGSGSACFGLFGSDAFCRGAAEKIRLSHPGWWVHAGAITADKA